MPYKDPEKQRRDQWFTYRLCVDCGTRWNLELDHVDPSKKVSHEIWSWSIARRDAEIAKCKVRCKSCRVAT